MKYCVNCKYSKGDIITFCQAPENGIDPVTGETKILFASINRGSECGEEAKFFNPKEANTKRGFIGFLKKVFN